MFYLTKRRLHGHMINQIGLVFEDVILETRMSRGNRRLLIISLLALSLGGCSGGSKDPSRPKTFPVTGVVIYHDQPVADAGVSFMPQNHEYAAVARTDQNGRFTLMTFAPQDGAVPGEYKVTMVKFGGNPKKAKQEMSDAELERRESKDEPPPAKSLIPEKYGNAKQTDLTAQISDSSKNDLTFNLKD